MDFIVIRISRILNYKNLNSIISNNNNNSQLNVLAIDGVKLTKQSLQIINWPQVSDEGSTVSPILLKQRQGPTSALHRISKHQRLPGHRRCNRIHRSSLNL